MDLRAAVPGLLLGVVVGFAAGSAWPSRDTARETVPDAPPPPATHRSAALEAERDRLASEVARLEAALGEALAARETAGAEGAHAEASDAAPDAAVASEAERIAALEAAGWPPSEIERLREAFEAFELERLYLRDQASREGWRGTPRFRREQRVLQEDLRSRLGDGDYDAALYAEGHANRVRVLSLLEDSPAQAAGIQPGDEILRYAGERVFDAARLVRLTAQGDPGGSVELRVLRNGQEIRLFVPRGPLGVRLRPVSSPPYP